MSSYSGYHSEGAPSSKRSSRKSRRPVYEEKIVESKQSRNGPPLQQALVRRPRGDSSSSIEEIDREFDPESGTYTQRRSVIRDRYGDRYGPPRPRSEAGYSGRGRRGTRRKYSDDSFDSYADSESSRSRSRPRRRSKSRGERALESVGLGGAVGAIAERLRSASRKRSGGRGRSRDSSADSYTYYSRSRSRGARARSVSRGNGSRSPTRKQKYEDAAKAALAAAAIEAWRARKEVPGDAGKRIITAALASAGIDAATQREQRHGNRNALVSALGGIATNRLINGQVRSRSRPGRRDRDSGTAGTAASVATLAAIAGKAIKDQHDRSRSKSRTRRRHDDSSDDGEQYATSSRGRKSLSEHFHKPTDAVLDKLGYGESSYHHSKYAKDKYGRRHFSDEEDDYDDGPRLRGGGGDDTDSDGFSTDSYSSDEEEKKIKKGRTKSLITGGLAAVATVHAAHSVYNSVEAREKRHRKVMEGKMSPEEARRLKTRAALQDVAAVGIAALGIKGAVSEWKEVREHRQDMASRRLRLDEMREHRQRKYENGEWDRDTWRRKRENHGNGSLRARSNSRPAPRPRQEAIEYRGRDSDYRGSSRRGQSAPRFSEEYEDYDDYYDNFDKPRSRRSYQSSVPQESSGRRKRRAENSMYVSSDDENFLSLGADEGPRYTDGNPYGAVQSSTLASQLPRPPLGYDHAPRH